MRLQKRMGNTTWPVVTKVGCSPLLFAAIGHLSIKSDRQITAAAGLTHSVQRAPLDTCTQRKVYCPKVQVGTGCRYRSHFSPATKYVGQDLHARG